jgi:SAM-dependent methyltransferase
MLNLGCGDRVLSDCINHDIVKHCPQVDVVHDLNALPWPWADNCFDMIEARSVFEHLKLSLIESCDECWRILKPSGKLSLLYPLADGPNTHHDPTHRWFWSERVTDFLDPDTEFGRVYHYYTKRKWRILNRGIIKDRNVKVIMEVRK